MYTKYVKRILDLLLGSVLFIIALPFFLPIVILIRLTSHGQAIFRQPRSGLGGREFTMYKFRTMAHDNDVHDTTRGDHVTTIGRILRMTSLDELPQLINVIKGDMSFIGPRPWITAYYKNMNAEQRCRYNVRPGITGLAQAYGRNNLTIHEKIAYDLEYVNNISLREDVKVILVTIKTLFDHEAHELGKGGIHEELDVLKSQNREPTGSQG